MDSALLSHVAFAVCTVAVAGVFVWLYFVNIFIVEDVSTEAMGDPLTVAYIEEARSKGVPLEEFFATDPLFKWHKRMEPNAYGFPRDLFIYECFAKTAPLIMVAYLPFIKMLGVSSKTVACYSTFYMMATILMMIFFAFKIYGRWCAVFSVLFLSSSIIWLIHTRIGYGTWMPSTFLIVSVAVCGFYYMKTQKRLPLMLGAGCGHGVSPVVGCCRHQIVMQPPCQVLACYEINC